jgi:stalled ribosome rescue protein Dom34
MAHRHIAVWLDHNEARIFHVTPGDFEVTTVVSPKAHVQLHRRSGPGGEAGHREPEDQRYYHQVAGALAGAEGILVLGPATAKLELLRHLHKHAVDVEQRIVGVETVDHPSDGQLAAYARRYFAAHPT